MAKFVDEQGTADLWGQVVEALERVEFKMYQAVGENDGMDAYKYVTTGVSGSIGGDAYDEKNKLPIYGVDSTFRIDFDLSTLDVNALLCHLSGMSMTVSGSGGSADEADFKTYALVNGEVVDIGIADARIAISKVSDEIISKIAINFVAVCGKPLKYTDTFAIVIESSVVAGDHFTVNVADEYFSAGKLRYILDK